MTQAVAEEKGYIKVIHNTPKQYDPNIFKRLECSVYIGQIPLYSDQLSKFKYVWSIDGVKILVDENGFMVGKEGDIIPDGKNWNTTTSRSLIIQKIDISTHVYTCDVQE